MKKILLTLLVLATLTACKNKRNFIAEQSLLNTKWLLQTINGESISNAKSEDEQQLYLFLEEGTDQLNGFAGCNRFFGSFELSDEGLKFNEVMSTKRGCDKQELEEKFLDLLNRVNSYDLKDNVLYLKTASDEIAGFKPSVVEE